MHVADSPRIGDRSAGGAGVLRLAALHRLEFGAEDHYKDRDRLYFHDLFATFGRVPDAAALNGGRTTFRTMAAALADPPGELAGGFDVAVLAHTTPDAEPGWPMSILVDAVPGAGLVFGVSDQGVVAPFTTLQLVLGQVYPGPAGRAVVWIMDQSSLLHRDPLPAHRQVTANSAVALILSATGGLGTLTFARQIVSRDGTEVRAALRAGLAELAGEGKPVTVVCGAGLRTYAEQDPLVADVRVAPPGRPCTGVWFTFADQLSDGSSLLVADYDEEFGYLGLCGVLPTGVGASPVREWMVP